MISLQLGKEESIDSKTERWFKYNCKSLFGGRYTQKIIKRSPTITVTKTCSTFKVSILSNVELKVFLIATRTPPPRLWRLDVSVLSHRNTLCWVKPNSLSKKVLFNQVSVNIIKSWVDEGNEHFNELNLVLRFLDLVLRL